MPPARLTLVRSNARTAELSNRRKELKSQKKPIEFSRLSKQCSNETKETGLSSDFMDIDEFFQNTTSQEKHEEECQDEKDYPKPQVDLLASLLTLGKMIQDQKQFMARQTQRASTDNIDVKHESPFHSELIVSCVTDNEIVENNNDNINKQKNDEKLNVENDTIEANLADSKIPEHNTYTQPSQINELSKNKTSSSSEENSRKRRATIPESIKDGDYWDRRRRNNLAAKKSREERRKKELEVLEAADRLSKENMQLTAMLKRLTARNELLESRLLKMREHQRESETSIGTTSDLSSN